MRAKASAVALPRQPCGCDVGARGRPMPGRRTHGRFDSKRAAWTCGLSRSVTTRAGGLTANADFATEATNATHGDVARASSSGSSQDIPPKRPPPPEPAKGAAHRKCGQRRRPSRRAACLNKTANSRASRAAANHATDDGTRYSCMGSAGSWTVGSLTHGHSQALLGQLRACDTTTPRQSHFAGSGRLRPI